MCSSVDASILILLFCRPRKNPAEGSGRDLVCPIILKQSDPVREEEEEEEDVDDVDDADDACSENIIRIGKNLKVVVFL